MGVWFRRPQPYIAFHASLEKLKLDVFGPSPSGSAVVLHRDDIVRRKGVYGLLNDQDRRRAFDEGLLQLVADTDFTAICVTIDKTSHISRYSTPENPYHYCMQAMLERYCFSLRRKRSHGDAASEARGPREDQLLREAYRGFCLNGTRFAQINSALSSTDLAVCSKAENVAGLQLADLLAKPLADHSIAERGLCDHAAPCFGTRLVEAALPKLDRRKSDGKVLGYGLVMLSPQLHKPDAAKG